LFLYPERHHRREREWERLEADQDGQKWPPEQLLSQLYKTDIFSGKKGIGTLYIVYFLIGFMVHASKQSG
jgi:hypothetical protein